MHSYFNLRIISSFSPVVVVVTLSPGWRVVCIFVGHLYAHTHTQSRDSPSIHGFIGDRAQCSRDVGTWEFSVPLLLMRDLVISQSWRGEMDDLCVLWQREAAWKLHLKVERLFMNFLSFPNCQLSHVFFNFYFYLADRWSLNLHNFLTPQVTLPSW